MNLNEIEDRNLKQKPQKLITNQSEPDQPASNSQPDQIERDPISPLPYVRSTYDWSLITKLVAALSACIGLVLGLAIGFPIGRITASPTTVTETGEGNIENSIYSQYDYTQFVINAEKNVTIANFYNNDEERYYAMNLIGSKMPTLKYLDSSDTEFTTESLGNGKYIIEFLEPECDFCKSMIDVLDTYRATEGSLPVLGLSIKDGDLSNTFNKNEENSFILVNKDNATDTLVNQIMWIPTFVYVENNEIKLVSFGVLTAEEITHNIDIAFN